MNVSHLLYAAALLAGRKIIFFIKTISRRYTRARLSLHRCALQPETTDTFQRESYRVNTG